MRLILILLIGLILIGCENYWHVKPYKESHEVNKGILPIHYLDGSDHDYYLITTETLFDYAEYCYNDTIRADLTLKGLIKWLEKYDENIGS